MKELCCKVLAAIFIVLIIASLVLMRNEIRRQPSPDRHSVIISGDIGSFDTVLVGTERCIGLVEGVSNRVYHVVFKNQDGKTVHGNYTVDQLQKVLIVIPSTSE